MVNTRRKHVKFFICKKKLCNEKWLQVHDQQYHPILMNEGLLPNQILPPAGFPHPEPLWFDYSRCTWMAIDKLSINNLLTDNISGAPPPEDTHNEESIDPQPPDLTCTPDPTKTKAQRQVVGFENAVGKAYGKATGLYNKHHKYSEQWNPWHPFWCVHDFQQAQWSRQQMKTWIDQHLRCGLDNYKIQSFQSADALRMFLSELVFGVGDDSWIEDESHIFGTLYSRDIFKCIQFLLGHLPFRHTSILNQCALLTLRVIESTARWTRATGGVIHWINFLPEWRLWQSYVHPTRLTWPILWAIHTPGHCVSWLVLFEKLSAGHLKSTPGFSLDWSHGPQKMPKTLAKHGIMLLELCCLNIGISASLALAWNGIVQMDSSENVTLCWLPGSGSLRNKSWLLKSHMAHAWCVKFQKVQWWGIQLLDHSITQETSIFTRSCWRTIILILCTLEVSTKSATSSGNTLSAMSIGFGSLMNCISCSWV